MLAGASAQQPWKHLTKVCVHVLQYGQEVQHDLHSGYLHPSQPCDQVERLGQSDTGAEEGTGGVTLSRELI